MRSGVVDNWKHSRSVVIWQDFEVDGYFARLIGDELSIRHGESFAFSAPIGWWEENAQNGRYSAGPIRVPSEVLMQVLARIREAKPGLREQAAKKAAQTQVRMEKEAEDGLTEPLILG